MTTRRPRPALVFALSWVLLTLIGALWALATPVGGSPDEPAHLVKAASVVRGQLVGEPSREGHVVLVPRYVAWTHAQTCYAFDPEKTAACSPGIPGPPEDLVESATTAGLYNPLYYALVGWPSLLIDEPWGIYAMRIVSAVVSTLFLAVSLTLVVRWRRPVLPIIGLATIATPMLFFLAGSVNPNALETTATLATLVGMFTLVREPGWSRPAWAAVVVGAAVAANTRGLSPIWVLIAIVAPLLILPFRDALRFLLRRPVIVGASIIAVFTVAGLVWTLASNSLGAAVSNTETQNLYPGAGSPAWQGFAFVLERTFGFGSQLIGLFGWMDTPAPAITVFVYVTLIGGLVVAALVWLRGRELLVVGVLLAAVVIVPALIQGAYVTAGGYIWQGRYAFAVFACLIVAATALLGSRAPAPSPRTARRVAVLLTLAVIGAQLYAFADVLKRYVVGEEHTWIDVLTAPEWLPPGGFLGLVAGFAVIITVGLSLAGRLLVVASGEEREHVQHESDGRPDGQAHNDAQLDPDREREDQRG